MSTYVFTYIAGNFTKIESNSDYRFKMSMYVKAKQKKQIQKDSERLFNLMEVSIDAYRDLFGVDYQFTKYDMIFVPNLTCRAMENPGAIVFNE